MLLQKFQPEVVINGADTICHNGDVINKIGSYPLALVCKSLSIPFIVISSTLKKQMLPKDIKILARESHEIWKIEQEGINIINYYFEKVPRELITAYITENGFVTDVPSFSFNLHRCINTINNFKIFLQQFFSQYLAFFHWSRFKCNNSLFFSWK